MTTNQIPPRILKANTARNLPAESLYNFDDLQQKCERYLESTKQQAMQILQEATEDAGRIKETVGAEARQEGKREGLQDAQQMIARQAEQLAVKQVQKQLQTVTPALQTMLTQFSQEKERWLVTWENQLISLSVAIAEKILRTALKDPEVRQEQLLATLQELSVQSGVAIAFHPADLEALGDDAVEIIQKATGAVQVTLHEDDSLQPGDCRLKTRHGSIDATVSTQLERMAAELLHQNSEE